MMSSLEEVTVDLPASPIPLQLIEAPKLDIEEELTVVEFTQPTSPVPQEPEDFVPPFQKFLQVADYPTPASVYIKQYVKDVRRRMIESRDFDREHFADSLYQRLMAFLRKNLHR